MKVNEIGHFNLKMSKWVPSCNFSCSIDLGEEFESDNWGSDLNLSPENFAARCSLFALCARAWWLVEDWLRARTRFYVRRVGLHGTMGLGWLR